MVPDEGKKNEACALITGASSGIGREYALLLAGRGFDLILVGNREEENRQVAREIAERYGVSVWPLYADLARPDAAERIHAETTARGWKVEVLVCNAGALRFGLLTNEAPEAVAGLVTLHCTTPALLCRHYGAEMRARGCGHILIMSSVTAWMPYPTVALYAATKSFLRSFARALHDEMHDVGVHVTAVFPGAVDTPLYRLDAMWRQRLLRWGVMMAPRAVAKKGLRALFRGRSRCIPGLFAKICVCGCRLLPAWAIRAVLRHPTVQRLL